jgi:hypothetical protein
MLLPFLLALDADCVFLDTNILRQRLPVYRCRLFEIGDFLMHFGMLCSKWPSVYYGDHRYKHYQQENRQKCHR